MISVLDVARVSLAVRNMLYEGVADLENVTRAEPINEIPAQCPWAGVYVSGVQYPSRILGAGPGVREHRIEFLLVLQQADLTSGEECHERLEALVRAVVGVLLSDTTLRNTVHIIDAFEISYPEFARTDEGAYMQTATIEFTALAQTQYG